ncbi:MAG: retroviral-like aspartic protease family protein [Gallionellaceae bacterium]|jgi:aspartyl protease family protein|nr:retroviral-like aspartic protease family protein [Gallionellaceae bacterium]
MKSSTLIAIVFWLALFAGLIWLLNGYVNPNKAATLGEARVVELKRDPSGHYRADAFINGKEVRVLVDTGATGVAISQSLADQLGLESNAAIRTTTANGDAVAYMVRLKEVRLGGIVAHDVSANIAPGLSGDALLGMSFLGRMDVRLYRGTMTIKQDEDN